ncbi:MAG: hypothetical protein CVT95_09205 [Bacteroidetes bacterium HGW-Bacteroidetes-12]|nr:MAG: hypothetical protein CVT95_09205 [Bacteroidetes bacterium HGW-Bacteroidetes-12]
MKKTILTLLILNAFTLQSFTQKNFEGTVTFKITYGELPPEMAGYESMLPKESITKLKEGKSKTTQTTAMGTNITISDKEGNVTILMNMMGQKIAIKESIDKEKDASSKPIITYVDETKKIAGYTCKKAELKFADTDEIMVVYYTEEIVATTSNSQLSVDGLKGFMMEYSINNQGIEMIISASTVTKEKISDAEFIVPSDYDVMTKEDFQKMMSGGE